ncbi:single-stranded DNA-binding protein [Flavobacterium fryxellicola]|uniref:Single-stranded DNA-binding protein n=1 Tax=Flavobacterium fryxellicola TaxID=249352 RepID=A0A167ZNG5_9FLAO|nr:single-stranded DNA-binding protein [Flavobacterium fryxellicola]OAB30622.1 single-stranded DNA-binding protein [Flavobacterium fryxellicola]
MNIIGRLTRDAEIHRTPQDKQVVNFSVAINDSYRNKQGERIEQTSYFDCSYWISPNVAKMLAKGTLVELTGRVSTRAWTATNGELRSCLNFHTSTIKLHGGSKKIEHTQGSVQQEKTKIIIQEPADDLPF